MKKFSFSLETVLDYKHQILENLQYEYGQINEEVRAQKQVIENLKNEYVGVGNSLKDAEKKGISVHEIRSFHNYIDLLSYKIRKENDVLAILLKKQELKRLQVLEASQSSTTIEKLREKRFQSYQKEVQKDQEKQIEEFVMSRRVMEP